MFSEDVGRINEIQPHGYVKDKHTGLYFCFRCEVLVNL
jgi:hypothetical protein